MKRILSLTIWLVFLAWSYSPAQSNNVSETIEWKTFYRDTLTATLDTMDIKFLSPERFDTYSIVAYTTAGADTVTVCTKTNDDTTWVPCGLADMMDADDTVSIVIGTVAKEYELLTSQPNRIRLVSASNDASTTIFIVQGKKRYW
jgi:hypothetical protein